jgi:hypothetical protein
MSERPSIVVLRAKPHGIPAEDYLYLLRNRLPDHSVELERTPRRERELIADADVAIGIWFDPELLDHAAELHLFACGAAGVDHPPLERLAEAPFADDGTVSGEVVPPVHDAPFRVVRPPRRRRPRGQPVREPPPRAARGHLQAPALNDNHHIIELELPRYY